MQKLTNKKIFIEIPTWLGDGVMATPSIENIIKIYPKADITIFGSFVSTTLFKHHPNVTKIIIDNSRNSGSRYINLYKLAKNAGEFDIAFSFRRNFTTKFLIFFAKAKEKFIYKRYTKDIRHQVLRYNDFINKSLNVNIKPNDLKVYLAKTKNNSTNLHSNNSKKPTLGINPGATYGNAKRWYPNEFAKVAIEYSKKYNIKIFGGPNETDIANDISKILDKNGIKNYNNLAGKTTIEELIKEISNLNLFITNDSGPMHLSAAFKIPTIAIFGPTKYYETSQWNNPFGKLLRKEFDCAPCMKRECPLTGDKHHQCMKSITYKDVINA